MGGLGGAEGLDEDEKVPLCWTVTVTRLVWFFFHLVIFVPFFVCLCSFFLLTRIPFYELPESSYVSPSFFYMQTCLCLRARWETEPHSKINK
jgi:hypothetical protein